MTLAADGLTPLEPRSFRLRLHPLVIQGMALAAGASLWELVFGYLIHIDWLPPSSVILGRTIDLWNQGVLAPALEHSLLALALGFVLSALGGAALGLAIAYSRTLEQMLGIYITALIVTPSIVLGPVFFVLFALSPATIVSIAVVSSLPFIAIGTRDAFRKAPTDLQEMARCFGGSRWRVFLAVTFPAALPMFLTAMRLGVGRAVKGIFLGQLVVTLVDFGFLAAQFEGAFDAAGALSIGLVVMVMAIVATGLVDVLDRRINWWV